jgi:hypothetical protein
MRRRLSGALNGAMISGSAEPARAAREVAAVLLGNVGVKVRNLP